MVSFGASLKTAVRSFEEQPTHRSISGNQDANQKRGSLEDLVDNSFGVSVSKPISSNV